MKRTLIVATTSYAGMGPYVTEIVNTFDPTEDVFFFFHDYEDDFFKKNIKKELLNKSVFLKKANSAKNKLLELLTNCTLDDSTILRVCKKQQIELVHYINGIPTTRMQRNFAKLNITVLSTVHDLEPHEAKKVWYKMLRHKIVYKRLANNLLCAKYLVTNSKEQYRKLKRDYPQKRITYHPFPSLVSKEITKGKDIPPELAKVNRPYVLFFGRIEAYKGVELLYKTFIESPELNSRYLLVIAGSGQLTIDRSKYKKNVLFINRYIKDTEVAYLYQNAKCVVYPYISATQSGVLSLAFYFNVPVVASDVPFFKDILSSTLTGYTFHKGDSNDLEAKIRKILAEDNSSMKTRQQEYYDNHYNGNAIHASLVKIYSMNWTEKDNMGGQFKCKKSQIVCIIKQKVRKIPGVSRVLCVKKYFEDRYYDSLRHPYIPKIQQLLGNDTSIISNNCFAGRVMQDLGMQYNSPTLGLYFWFPDYIEFLTHLKYYLTDAKLEFVEHSKYALGDERRKMWKHWYPIGLLDGKVEIAFLHYHSEKEAAEKWYRRSKRINWSNLLIIGFEQNLCTVDDIKAFDDLPFEHKIFFSSKELVGVKSNCYIPDFSAKGEVGDPYRKGHVFYKYLINKFK